MPQHPLHERLTSEFFGRATQYYIAGRYASLAQLFPVNANLLHQAVELYLKGALLRFCMLDDLHRCRHNLKASWQMFKSHYPASDLMQFDLPLSALHKFERIRYPDEVVLKGMVGRFSLRREDVSPSHHGAKSALPSFSLVLEEIDHLVQAIFDRSGVNPAAFLDGLIPVARQYALERNEHPLVGAA